MIGLLLTDKPLQDRPPVDDAQPQSRGRFQFSLRKLMIWTAVLGAYLGVMQWAKFGITATVIFGLSLAAAVVIRLTLRVGPGLLLTSWLSNFGIVGLRFGFPPWGDAISYGLLFMIVLLIPASIVLWAVNKIDALMQTKTPPATDNPVNQTQRPDAASSKE
jgi:hypothetical protein